MTLLRNTATRIYQDIRRIWIALVILFSYALITQAVFKTFCPFLILTGFPCPGCGLTRAAVSALCGRFQDALQWNAAIFLWLPYLFYLCLFRYVLGKKIPAVMPLTVLVCLGTLACYFSTGIRP